MPEKPDVDPIDIETPDQFHMRFLSEDTKALGFIETNPSVFKHFVGNQPTAYFWMKNIKVFVKGTREDIEKRESQTTTYRVFGE